MAGLSLRIGGFGGVGSTDNPSYGTDQSYDSVTQAAFGPGATLPADTVRNSLHPSNPVGAAVWSGVAAILVLVLVRRSLPR